MRDAIHALKYQCLMPAAQRLGGMLAQAIGQLAADAPAEMLVVPVPLHRSKFASRGFNQARLLAAHALAELRRTHPGWRLVLASSTVVRQRATESQAGLTPRQRRINVRGAFVVPDAQAVRGRHVLMIDDILTTGATARSVAQVLLRAGAANVWVATLARARQGFERAGQADAAQMDRVEGQEQRIAAGTGPAHVQRAEDMEDKFANPNQPSF